MPPLELVIVVISGTVMGLMALCYILLAWHGKDLEYFDRLKTISPWQYRNLK